MDKLKKLLDAGTISQEVYDILSNSYSTLTNQRDSARQESASRRIKLQEVDKMLKSYKQIATNVADKFGINLDDDDDFVALDDKLKDLNNDDKVDKSKVTELETKLQRALNQVAENETLYKQEKEARTIGIKQRALIDELSKHNLFDPRLIANDMLGKTVYDEDSKSVKFKDADGILVDLKEGVTKVVNENIGRWGKAQGEHSGSGATGSIAAVLKTSNSANDVLKAAGLNFN